MNTPSARGHCPIPMFLPMISSGDRPQYSSLFPKRGQPLRFLGNQAALTEARTRERPKVRQGCEGSKPPASGRRCLVCVWSRNWPVFPSATTRCMRQRARSKHGSILMCYRHRSLFQSSIYHAVTALILAILSIRDAISNRNCPLSVKKVKIELIPS